MNVCRQVKLEKLEEQFEEIERERLQYPKTGMVCMALVRTDLEDGSSEDVFLRARVQEITGNQVNVEPLLLPTCCKYLITDAH